MAEKAIEEGYTDAVALGKACLADAEWANKAKRGDDEDIRPCIGCQNGCMARVFNGGLVTCAVNPALFYEKSDPVTPAAVKKHVVVIGGGVGGCEAAIIAAQRGHEVDLYEKADKLGGLFNLAAVPDFKTGDHRLLAWYAREVRKAGVRVHLNTTVTAADVEKMGADAIIVATGANPKNFSIAGCETVTASDVLAGRDVGKNCVIVGGGLVGCETAVWLARKGVKVTLVEALPMLMSAGTPVPTPNFLMMLDMLPGAGVDVYTGSKFASWADGKAVIVDAEGKEHSVEAETVVQAVALPPTMRSTTSLSRASPSPCGTLATAKSLPTSWNPSAPPGSWRRTYKIQEFETAPQMHCGEKGVQLLYRNKVTGWDGKELSIENVDTGERQSLGADVLVLSTGVRPNAGLYDELIGLGQPNVYKVGDANFTAKIVKAVQAGSKFAKALK